MSLLHLFNVAVRRYLSKQDILPHRDSSSFPYEISSSFGRDNGSVENQHDTSTCAIRVSINTDDNHYSDLRHLDVASHGILCSENFNRLPLSVLRRRSIY